MPDEAGPKIPEKPKTYEIDISYGWWDTASQIEVFLTKLRGLPFYRPGLLYSGFDAKKMGKQEGSSIDGVIFAENEDALTLTAGLTPDATDVRNNPLAFALENEHPAIAVYDANYMSNQPATDGLIDGYVMEDKKALLAIILIKH